MHEVDPQIHTLIESINAGLIIHNSRGLVIDANQRARALLGDHLADLEQVAMGRACDRIFDENLGVFPSKQFPVQRVIGNKETNSEVIFATRDPQRESYRWFALESSPFSSSIHRVDNWDIISFVTDITSKKSLEYEAKQNCRYRMLFEKSKAIMFLIDPSTGRIMDANQSACRFYGYTHQEILQLTIFDINTLPRKNTKREMSRALSEKKNTFHFRHRLKDGSIRHVEVFSCPICLEDRIVLHSIIHDVTKARALQVEIARRNRDIELISHILDISRSETNDVEMLRQVNDILIAELDFEIGLLFQRSDKEKDYDLIFQQQRQEKSTLTHLSLQNISNSLVDLETKSLKVPIVTYEIERKRNSKLTATIQKALCHMGIQTAIAVILRLNTSDEFFLLFLTQRKHRVQDWEINLLKKVQLELVRTLNRRKLARTAQLLKAVIDQATVAVVIANKNGLIEYVNPAFETVTGYTTQEVIGKQPFFLKSDAHSAEFYARILGKIQSGKVWKGQLVSQSKRGGKRTQDVLISPVRDHGDYITHFIAIYRDVTEEKEREKRIQQAQRLESIGRLASGIAHDINNHLATIITVASLIGRELPHEHHLSEDVQSILQTAQKAGSLVRQLLVFSRQQTPEPQIIDINKYIFDQQKILRRMIGRNIELVILLSSTIHYVEIDSSQLQQVLFNVVVNAIDAMPHGGKLTIEVGREILDDESDDISLERDPYHGPFVWLAIRDTGTGIPEDICDKIFDPFFTTKPRGTGTGLGLATCFGIIKNAGGHIRVRTITNVGTEFQIYLPEKEVQDSESPPARVTNPPLGGDETILLVDDEETFRIYTARMLKSLGYQVTQARNGEEALQIWLRNRDEFDLIITDLFMPGMGGYELIHRMCHFEPFIRIILISGFSDIPILKPEGIPSFVRYLSKPFTPDEISSTIRELIDSTASC